MKRDTRPQPIKCCETCGNLTPIGDGDHICDACEGRDGHPCALVLEDYNPGIDYYACGGRKWAPQ